MKEVEIYSRGIVSCSVCAINELSVEQVTQQVNIDSPTGIQSNWELAEDTHFKEGKTNPCECENDPNRKHYLFHC